MKKFAIAAVVLFPLSAMAAEGKPGAHFIENWDLDGNGTVTLTELQERRDNVFSSFDANDDGFLDTEEYALFDEARKADMEGQGDHGKGQMRRVQAGMTLVFNDSDGDGKASREEFVGKAADWLATIDRDGSSDLTSADFGPQN